MKIKKLRLKGWTGIKKGLGLNEIEVDFSKANGLIALAGQNGTGKSSLIENLSPFNRLASRSGALFQHVFTRDAERELTFDYQGHEYRTLLKIDAQSGKSEGYIWRDGESLVNGKISAYAKAVAEIFGSPELFYNSVFCSQNATKLSDMTTGELKGLFAEFLRLDRLQGYEEAAKQRVNVLSGKASQIDISIEALRKRIESVTGTKEQIERLESSVTIAEDMREEGTAKLSAAQNERERLKEVIARNEVFVKQADELAKMITGMQKNRDEEGGQIEDRLSKLREVYVGLTWDIKAADEILFSAAAIHAHAENKKALEELIGSISANLEHMTDNVTAAQAAVTAVEKEIAELKAKVILPEKDVEIQALNMSITSALHNIETRESQLQALDVRDPECTSKTCSFILSALKAQDELPGLKDALHIAEVAKEQRANELIALGADIGRTVAEKETTLKQDRAKLAELTHTQSIKRQELATKRRELSQYQDVAEKLSALAVAQSKKEDRVKALEENKTQGRAISEAWAVKKAELGRQIDEQREKLMAMNSQINDSAPGELRTADITIERVQGEIAGSEKTIAETSARIAKLEGELSGIQEAEEQLRKAADEKNRVAADMAEWAYIKNACGKNGLQAMEIDGAVPAITSYANDLLSKSFGPLFTVKIATQSAEGKECFDIFVIGEDGEEILFDNKSGGEKVWCLMALRLAMTLLSKDKSGRNFETVFADELDGPLDPENAANFIQLYRSFMETGNFGTFPFISHKPECRSMADHVLMFEAGENPYWQ